MITPIPPSPLPHPVNPPPPLSPSLPPPLPPPLRRLHPPTFYTCAQMLALKETAETALELLRSEYSDLQAEFDHNQEMHNEMSQSVRQSIATTKVRHVIRPLPQLMWAKRA